MFCSVLLNYLQVCGKLIHIECIDFKEVIFLNSTILSGIEPQKVFYYFEEISKIPRGSGKTDKISKYCADFAQKRNLDYIRDENNNVIIFKGATPGYEDKEPVILQGHLDMVWEKDADSPINFETDPLELAVDGDYIYARGTTLGGDDGIAVAMFLALLDSDGLSHPPLEVVLTTDEETGMDGAFALDTSVLKGRRMMNLDSENEGTLWVSCAGGERVDIFCPVNYIKSHGTCCEITVSGLHGGHSGAEIHIGYANANILMRRLLAEMNKSIDFSISQLSGGKMDNAITRECKCRIMVFSDIEALFKVVSKMKTQFAKEYSNVETTVNLKITECSISGDMFDKASTQRVIKLLTQLPNGVISMSRDIEGLVETSLNLGVLDTSDDSVHFGFSVRSGVDSERKKLVNSLIKISEENSARYSVHGEYPAWEFKKDSPLREIMADVYKKLYGKDMTVTAIHAGLECGLFSGKINNLDCVSFGPDIFDIHSPSERLSISSSARVWEYLCEVLKNL